MDCTRVRVPGGGVAFVCGRGRRYAKSCRWCGSAAPLLCDWKLPGGRTCSKEICAAHAFSPEPGKDLCPLHRDAYRRWLVEVLLIPLC